ncbi:MAG: hypothetical protein PVG41_07860, partial [Desulfobacteraceae bacterium]
AASRRDINAMRRPCRGETPLPRRRYTAIFFIAALGKALIIAMNRIHPELLTIVEPGIRMR